MDVTEIDEVRTVKRQLRIEAAARRAKQPDAERMSRAILDRVVTLPEYTRARTIMLYLDIRDEVRTRWFVPTAWSKGKQVVVPYCNPTELGLFRLDSFDELAASRFGVLEPTAEWRARTERAVEPREIDLVIAPGLAFDRQGGRLGYGKGYYDRFLEQTRTDALRLGVCFDCQLVPEVPLLPHDVRLDIIVTESAVFRANS
jgi:5-formyltetrahydrofolate cyclo-ligase